MKNKAAFVVLAFLLCSLWARAQTFTASTLVTTADQLLDSGTLDIAFDAYDMGLQASTTVDGMTFSGNYGVNFGLIGFDPFALGAPTPPTLDPSFGNILSFAVTSASTNMSGYIELNNLDPGRTYEFQLFAGLNNEAGAETVSDGDKSTVLAYDGSGTDFITETFVPTSSTELINLASVDPDGLFVLNAFDLHEEFNAVPEPSVSAMMLAGGLLVLELMRRRLLVLSR